MSETEDDARERLPARRHPATIGHAHALDEDDLLHTFLLRYDRRNTREAYANDLRDFFGAGIITLSDVRQVTFVHVNHYLSSLEAAGMKATTIKRRVAALRGFFEWLMAVELIERNPANKQLLRRVRSARQRDRTIIALTVPEAEALLAATETAGETALRDRVLILAMLHCVLRRSEAAAMDAEHIRPLGHYWVLDLPLAKGGADQYVKIPAHVVEEIEIMKAHYGIRSGPLWRSHSRNSRGERLSPHWIYMIVKQAALRAGLSDRIGAHTLRHTGCTLALEAGATLQQVQSHARHKNLETTMMYIHQRDRLRDSAADFIHLKR